MQYQVQEMLRAERIFEAAGIQDELDVYNALIPDGSNWKATMLIEFEDVAERRKALTQLIGIEKQDLDAGRRAMSRCMPSPMKTWSGRTRTRPHRCISCVSNWPQPWSRRSKKAPP